VEVSWENTSDEFTLSTGLPQGVTAELILPVSQSRFPDLISEGLEFVGKSIKSGRRNVELGDGAPVRVRARTRC
jgi:hypothetical protein